MINFKYLVFREMRLKDQNTFIFEGVINYDLDENYKTS